MVEFAMVLPVMLLIVTGICSFGIAMNSYVLLTDATNSGARQLAVSRGSTTDPCSLVSTTVKNAGPLLSSSNLVFTLNLNGNSYTGTSCSSNDPNSGAAGNLVQGSTASVTVTYPCSLKVYGRDIAPGCKLQAIDAELVQ